MLFRSVLGKVFSPQFLLWLVPLVALLGGSLALAGCLAVAAAIVLTRAYFPDHWVGVIQLEAGPTWYLVARDLVLLGLLSLLVVALARTPYRVPSATSHVAGTPRRR